MAGNQFKYLNMEYIDNQNDNNNNNNKWLNDNDLIKKLGDNNRRKVAVSRSGRFKAKNKYRETIHTDLFQQDIIKDDDKSLISNDKKTQQSDTDKTTITSTSKNIINYQKDDQPQQQQTHGNICIKRHSKTSEHFEIKI